MAVFEIDDLSTINILRDRGSNFLKAFQDLNPVICYAHRLNNVLKRSFFQYQKQPSPPSTISVEKTYASDDEENSDDDDSFAIPSKPMINRNLNVSPKVGKDQMMTTKLIDAPPAGQLLIKTIVECKSLAKYIKKSKFIHFFSKKLIV